MNLDRIIVGIDFSPESITALEHAIVIARKTGAAITMVHAGTVYEPLERVDGPNPSLVAEYQEIIAEHQSQVRDKLGELRERFDGQGVEISHSLIDGFADSALSEAAKELGAGLVAVGTHGRTGIKRFLLGSIAEKVVRMCETDVLVARPGKAIGGYKRILVPTDFSPIAERALGAAIAVAAPDAEIDLFHCWQLPTPVTSHYIPLTPRVDSLRQLCRSFELDARAQAKPLLDQYRGDGYALSFDPLQSPPAHGIQERSAGYDLIAMGSHGRRGFRRLMLGSVAESTVRHAPCSVLVAHGGDV